MKNRYQTEHNLEAQVEPGSDGAVLVKKLQIKRIKDINDMELSLLIQLVDKVLDEVTEDQIISANDLCLWHKHWLGNVYDWAGEYRTVNIGKAEFQFASAHLIPRLMQDLNHKFLSVYLPCKGMTDEQLIEAMAKVHIEFILVHPFREGNGRLSRLLANIMALQAGQPMLDFSVMDNKKQDYFTAVQAGLDNDQPMQEIFKQVLQLSQKNAAS